MTNTISILQEDNLVRFLNAVESASDIVAVIDAEDPAAQELKKEAGGIFAVRDDLGAFFNIFDVGKALNLEGALGRALVNAARRPLLMGPAVARIGGAFATGQMSPLLFGRLFFDIDWTLEPAEWGRPLMRLSIALGTKRLTIQMKLNDAESRVASVKRRLKLLRDAGADTSALEAELERADGEVKAMEREAEALNKALQKKDYKSAWAIVRRNLVAEMEALRTQARAIQPTTLEQAREKNRLEDEADEIQRDIERIEEEVSSYKPG